MRIRIRLPNGQSTTLSDLSENFTVQQLRQKVAQDMGIDAWDSIQLASNVPPRAITEDDKDLKSAGIPNGSVVLVTISNTPARKTQPPPPPPPTQVHGDAVALADGFLVLRVMDDDNSCLFRSVGKYALERNSGMSSELRSVVASCIAQDPFTYSDAVLGQSQDAYVSWIQKSNSWGGAIELSIFSSYYGVEIDSIDVQSGRVDKFGEGSFEERVLVVYSGIHYDVLAMAPTPDSPAEFDQTRFSAADESVLDAAKALTKKLRQAHKYTDVANFTLRCQQCKKGLIGEKDARQHAQSTGHVQFVEYD